jgi:hypothetical protein
MTFFKGLTVISIVFEIAEAPDWQVAFETNAQVIKSLFTGKLLKVELVAPWTRFPFFLHWYEGLGPPLTATALKVTDVPEQTGFEEAVIDTLTGSDELTDITMAFDVAGLPLGQTAFEVITQRMASLFAGI